MGIRKPKPRWLKEISLRRTVNQWCAYTMQHSSPLIISTKNPLITLFMYLFIQQLLEHWTPGFEKVIEHLTDKERSQTNWTGQVRVFNVHIQSKLL